MGLIVLQLLFYKGDFVIKYPTKVGMPLNEETKSNQLHNKYKH